VPPQFAGIKIRGIRRGAACCALFSVRVAQALDKSRKVLILENHLRERRISTMRNRNRNILDAQPRSNLSGHAVQPQRRLPAGKIRHFNVHPAHAMAPSRPQRLHRRFLHGESPRITLEAILVPLAVRNFSASEQPVNKSLPVARDRRFDTIYLRDVHAHSDDHMLSLCAPGRSRPQRAEIIPAIEIAQSRANLAGRAGAKS
jgi:hypothetical protein